VEFWPNEPNFATIYQWLETAIAASRTKSTKRRVSRHGKNVRHSPRGFGRTNPIFRRSINGRRATIASSRAKRSKAWVSGEQPPHTAKVLAERTQFFDNISMAEKQPIVLCRAKSAKS
jgi:hypothetical protein